MKFKTKQIEIEAWREGCGEPMPEVLLFHSEDALLEFPISSMSWGRVYNGTLDSWIDFSHDDWLIYSNGADDIYPCTDEQFQKKYEMV